MSLKNKRKSYLTIVILIGVISILLGGCTNIQGLCGKAAGIFKKNSSDGKENLSSIDIADSDSLIDEITAPGTDDAEGETAVSGEDPEEGEETNTSENDDPDAQTPPDKTDDTYADDPLDSIETDPKPKPPEKTEEYGLLPESERAEDSYFDDAVFIGDSVSVMLKYYTAAMRGEDADFLGKAQFLCNGSFGYRNAVLPVSETSLHPVYDGEKRSIEESISLMGAKKIYIMLGMNDIANRHYDATFENIDTLVSRIREKSPDTVFYFQSVTPRMENSQIGALNNDIIREFDDMLCRYCAENEHYFINVYEAVCGEDGSLLPEYCGDPISEGGNGMGIHFTYAGCKAWTDYLYTHVS